MLPSHDIVTSIQLSTNCNLTICIFESRHLKTSQAARLYSLVTKVDQPRTCGDRVIDRGGWGYSDGFLHIFVSTGYPISHKIILKCQFMQTALALQNQSKSFFPSLYPVSRN